MDNSSQHTLSRLTQALLKALNQAPRKPLPLEGDEYRVSETASFFGFMYEKIRNSIEFNEEHLIRKYAIVRILKRRLAINPSGDREGENLVRELLWGKYLDDRSISKGDVAKIQHVIDTYIRFFKAVKSHHSRQTSRERYGEHVLNMLASEIEEVLTPHETTKNAAYLYYFYQTLKDRIHLEKVSDSDKDMFFYVAAERAYAKNDNAFILYNIFTLQNGPLHKMSEDEQMDLARDFPDFMKEVRRVIKNPYYDKLLRFAKKQLPPYKILYSILDEKLGQAENILLDKEMLQKVVSDECSEKYELTSKKLKDAAIRSIIYIFATKMLIVLLIEMPVSKFIYDELHVLPLAANTVIPPILMGIIVTFISGPSNKNTGRIVKRIQEFTYAPDESDTIVAISKRETMKRPGLLVIFTILYLTTFTAVFGGMYYGLDMLGFNIISKAIFFFFICVVTFFGYRIRQTAKEYVLEREGNVLMQAITFLFLPILYVGKFLSNQVSRINVLILFFDTLIEAPFKFIVDIMEEWISFLKDRKDELV